MSNNRFNIIRFILGLITNTNQEKLTLSKRFSKRVAPPRRIAMISGVMLGGVLILAVLLVACTENGGVNVNNSYTCTNGTAVDGTTTSEETERCMSCNDGFKLQNRRCVDTEYICEHGTPPEGKPSGTADETKCASCNEGYIAQGTTACVGAGQYFCTNGTPQEGSTDSIEEVHQCASCFQGYKKLANNQCTRTVFTCSNGMPTGGNPATGNEDVESCQSCHGGYKQDGSRCTQAIFTCTNGIPTTGNPTTGNKDVESCQSCIAGYAISGQMCVVADNDNDGVLNAADSCPMGHSGWTSDSTTDSDGDGCRDSDEDVDDNNNGLIEISSLIMLHNMRYNLSGTGYNTADSRDGTGDSQGAPTSATINCDAATDGAYLCGYELTQSLTFDTDSDGTFSSTGGDYTLDSNDNNATYFPVTSGAGGWLPIGDDTYPFRAIFEGNGHTITGLAIKRNQTYLGMFGYTNTGAHIRNVGLVSNLVNYSGTSDSAIYMGGLVGYHGDGSIVTSYSTGSMGRIHGNEGDTDRIGGLVGYQGDGSIIASYSTARTHGDQGDNDIVGGLVGQQGGGSIIASYATGSVRGGNGDDSVGGLVGQQSSGGSIIASYATGSVNGGSGSSNDKAGALVGEQVLGTITASYGFGTVSNGSGGQTGSTLPTGVDEAADLTTTNLTGCVGIANEKAYTSQTTCEANSKTPYTWDDTTNTCSGSESGINYTVFTTETACEGTTKTAGTWNGDVWNSASGSTANAWNFGNGVQAPALQYADFDGPGTTYNCSYFPSAVTCGITLLPSQR